ncbi:MAG: hypothetical protein MSS16_07050 [Streptococcus orisratti]|uniref:hypothetical protein n=1 Tax=Streptococcus orisratti TaxID=114652 RepID=UPI00235684A1|nr:hypothetical protein [Streptococcus orisratti]MCI7677823.1 hypothetical protein [Streptococcus orisratti]
MSLIEANEKIAEKVVNAHKVVEKTVVNGYKVTETAAVNSFTKVSDKFIGKFFTKDNETLEEAKARLQVSAIASKERSKAKHDAHAKHVVK